MQKASFQTTYDNEKTYWWYQARADIVEHIFARIAGTVPREILNIGCGTGFISRRFEKFGQVLSLDYSADALQFCAANRLDALAQASGVSLPLKTESFDACLALDVIEHIREDTLAVQEISRVLKPGGLLLATVPAFQWMWSKMDELGHFRRYTKSRFGELLKNAGLKPLIFSYYSFFLFPLAVPHRFYERLFKTKMEAGDFIPPLPASINKMFYHIFRWERVWLGYLSFPFGLSILALAEKTRKES